MGPLVLFSKILGLNVLLSNFHIKVVMCCYIYHSVFRSVISRFRHIFVTL